ncbi:YdgA family protein [Pseudomonas oryzihabitans]|uniref:YdgA family protein n=1 Tax=Pseudomonas oryzihabitans TaxID=47885 RepID=UPI002895A189|nr:YdgA family protein [Pseudomonas oryzihabitans]MDT3723057.1 YdgA family protein [Pseudomonas oryzihabitans]
MKKPLLTTLAGLALVAVGIGVGGAWYTGGRLEAELRQAASQAQAALQAEMPEYPLQLQLADFQRGLFSSTAVFSLTLQPEGRPPVEMLRVQDSIQHGPFPLARLKSLQLTPVMAVNSFTLADTATAAALLGLTKGTEPIRLDATLGYDRSVDGQLMIAPLHLDQPQGAVAFSGMNASFRTDLDARQLRLEGTAGQFSVNVRTPEGWAKLEMEGFGLTGDNRRNADGFWLGPGQLRLARVSVSMPGKPEMQLLDLNLQGDTQQQGQRLSGTLNASLGRLDIAGQTLGKATLKSHYTNLDSPALAQLNTLLQHLQLDAEEGLDPTTQATLQQQLNDVLAARPQLVVDELRFDTAGGSNQLRLDLTLDKPTTYDLPPEQLIAQLLTRLDARLSLARGSLVDGVLFQTGAPRDQPALRQQAQATAEALASIGLNSGLLKAEGDDLVASLAYAAGRLTLNGQEVPPERLLALLERPQPPAPAKPQGKPPKR